MPTFTEMSNESGDEKPRTINDVSNKNSGGIQTPSIGCVQQYQTILKEKTEGTPLN